MKISCVIVNYNTTSHLKECIQSIIDNCSQSDVEIIVVDNASTESSIKAFPEKFPTVKFIFADQNNGFGAGCNLGVKSSTGDFIAFVNPDLVLEENVFLKLGNILSKNETGICGTIMKDFDGNSIYSYNKFPGIFWEFLQATGKGTNEFINEKLLCTEIVNSEKPIKVDWIVGALMVCNKKVFWEVGGFDEHYFLYYEDTDLCKMIHDKGYKNVIVPGLKVKHFQRGSIGTVKSENIYYFNMMRSRLIFIHKHYNFFKRFIIRSMLFTGYLLRKIVLNIRRKFNDKRAVKNFQYSFTLKLLMSKTRTVEKLEYSDIRRSEEILKFENEKILKFTD